MKTATKAQVEMTVRCKAFSGEGIKAHRVRVDDVNVRVYDSASGHFTLCHILSRATVNKIIKRAANGEGR
jgi:hypothetical protein